jgi:uncharacterized protein (DUF849 family)
VPHQGAVQGQRKDGTPLVMLEAALNGARGLDEHPGVPRSPRDVAEAAAAAVDAGARAVHVHAFDQDGHETLAPTDNAAVLHAVRQLCPGVPISLTTRSDLEPDPRKRLGLIASWTTLPDLVTANQGEDGIVDICEHLIGRGVGIEAGLLDVADAEAIVRSELADRCTRVLLEPLDPEPGDAVAHARAMEGILASAGVLLPRVYHGDGIASWAVSEYGLRQGHGIRTGLEDTVVTPDSQLAADNAELVRIAAELVDIYLRAS